MSVVPDPLPCLSSNNSTVPLSECGNSERSGHATLAVQGRSCPPPGVDQPSVGHPRFVPEFSSCVAYATAVVGESASIHYADGVTLSQQQKKSASALAWNVKYFVAKYGINNIGFLTLTFPDHVVSPKESQRRFNSLRSHVLANRYLAHVRVLERQKSGRIHYHLLVASTSDFRSGVDFDAFSQGDYRSASKALRDEWAFWRATAPRYEFGRTELLPIKSTAEGIGRYVGKYISKHLSQRCPEDKGIRLVEYSRGARMASTRFGWVTAGAAAWRRKVRLFASIMTPTPVPFRSFSAVFGPRWAFHFRDFILSLPDPLEVNHENC